MTGWRVERNKDGEAVLTFGGLPFGQGFGLVASLGEQAPVAYAALANALARDAQVAEMSLHRIDFGWLLRATAAIRLHLPAKVADDYCPEMEATIMALHRIATLNLETGQVAVRPKAAS